MAGRGPKGDDALGGGIGQRTLDPSAIALAKSICPGLRAELDDLISPRSELIYTIRPPPELIPYTAELAQSVGSDLLVRPYWGRRLAYTSSGTGGGCSKTIVRHGSSS